MENRWQYQLPPPEDLICGVIVLHFGVAIKYSGTLGHSPIRHRNNERLFYFPAHPNSSNVQMKN